MPSTNKLCHPFFLIVFFLLIYHNNKGYAQSYEWASKIGNSTTESGQEIAVDKSGNVFITGRYSSVIDVDPGADTVLLTSSGGYTLFIAKYNSQGEYIWAKGIESNASVINTSMALDNASNLYLTGYFYDTADFDPGIGVTNLISNGSADIYIAKYDSSGNLIWAKGTGGTSLDISNGLSIDNSGNVYICGYFWSTTDLDPGAGTANYTSFGDGDIFYAKYNNVGDYVFAKRIGSSEDDVAISIAVDTIRSIYITGTFKDSVDFDPGGGTTSLVSFAYTDAYIGKYDSLGNFLWVNHIGGDGNDIGNKLALDVDDNIYITGGFADTVDFDPGTGTANLAIYGLGDVFIAKYDPAGNYYWAKSMGSSYGDNAYELALDQDNNAYIAGIFSDVMVVDPASSVYLVSNGLSDVYLVKFDAFGNHLWAGSIGGVETDKISGLAADSLGNTYLTGHFKAAADFDPGSGTAYLNAVGLSYDVYFAKYASCDNVNSSFIQTADTVCQGQTVDFTNISTGAISYEWRMDGVVFSTSLNSNATFDSAGTFTISLTATSGTCNDLYQKVVVINPNPYVELGNDTDTCDSVFTVDAGNPGSSYNWSTGDTSQIVTVTTTGFFWVDVTDFNNCISRDSIYVELHQSLALNDLGNDTSVCDSIQIDAGNYPNASILWSTGDTTQIITVTATNTYSMTAINVCGAVFDSITILVSPTEYTNASISICSGDSIFIQGSYQNSSGTYYDTLLSIDNCDSIISTSLLVNPLPTNPTIFQNDSDLTSSLATSYQWYYYDTLISGATSQYHIALQSGFYSVLITDANDCSALSNPVSVTITDVQDLSAENKLSVYPNPVRNSIYFSDKSLGCMYEIIDNSGQLVQMGSVIRGEVKTNKLISGIYCIRIFIDGKFSSTRFVKQ